MFEILLYLFENYMRQGIALKGDPDVVIQDLERAGFHRLLIGQALDWLGKLICLQESAQSSPPVSSYAMRHYTDMERERLGIEGRGFLLYLEQVGILDSVMREIVIDRLMALDYRSIDISGIKWVTLMVLFNQPDRRSALLLLQDMVLTETSKLS